MELSKQRVAFIGRLDRERELTRRLERLGAEVTRELDESVTLVVIGRKAKAKLGTVQRLGIPTMTLSEVQAALATPTERKPRVVKRDGPTTHAELVRELAGLTLEDPLELRDSVRSICRQARENGIWFDGYDPARHDVRSTAELEDRTSLLLFWCEDACASYVIPHEEITTAVLRDLRVIHGLVFAGSDDCTVQQLGAAVRTLFALRGGDADAFHLGWSIYLEDSADDPALDIRSADDLRPLGGTLSKWFGDVERQNITEIVAVSKEH